MPRFAILSAINKGDFEKVKSFIERGLDVNAKIQGTRPLERAIEKGRTKIIRYLLEKGANPNKDNILTLSTCKDNYKITKILLKIGANSNRLDCRLSATHWAAIKNNPRLLELLMKYGGNPFKLDGWGNPFFESTTISKEMELYLSRISRCNKFEKLKIEHENVKLELKREKEAYENHLKYAPGGDEYRTLKEAWSGGKRRRNSI